MKALDDPTIERIRSARHEISEQVGHDPRRLVEYYIELQKEHAARLLNSPESDAFDATRADETPA